MSVVVECEQCGRKLNAPDALRGKCAKCECGAVVSIPASPESQAPVEPESQAPVEPESQASAEPESQAFAEPESQASAEPESPTSAEPPAEPEPTRKKPKPGRKPVARRSASTSKITSRRVSDRYAKGSAKGSPAMMYIGIGVAAVAVIAILLAVILPGDPDKAQRSAAGGPKAQHTPAVGASESSDEEPDEPATTEKDTPADEPDSDADEPDAVEEPATDDADEPDALDDGPPPVRNDAVIEDDFVF
ncbi:MAG: hypothetical protein HQ592_17210 [Planctomycetes bacterium]|nr:hypothetical protein [Planctomycetota bacterium]